MAPLSNAQRDVLVRMSVGDSLSVVAYTDAWLWRRRFFSGRERVSETCVWITTVRALEDRGLIKGRMSEVSRNCYYTLTDAGKKAARELKRTEKGKGER